MLLQTLQHTLSQLLAPARSDVRTSAMAVTGDGRIVPVNAAKVDLGRTRLGYGLDKNGFGVVTDWFGRCLTGMSCPSTAGDAPEFTPIGHSQPARSAKT